MPIPVSFQHSNPGIVDLASVALRKRMFEAEQQQAQQKQLQDIVMTIAGAIKQGKQQGDQKKEAGALVEKLKGEGYNLNWEIKPSTGEYGVTAKKQDPQELAQAANFAYMTGDQNTAQKYMQMYLDAMNTRYGQKTNTSQTTGEPTLEEIEAELQKRGGL